jgi:hypothetical protein
MGVNQIAAQAIKISSSPAQAGDRISVVDFRLWHKSEVPERIDDVCSWGQSGRNMLAASLSAFDPAGH